MVLTTVRFGPIGKGGSGRVGDRLAANVTIDPIEARDDSRRTGGASRSAAAAAITIPNPADPRAPTARR